jgi:hypothetical protein
MAKRKLSESQRVSIRKELGALLRTSKTKAEALRTVAKKYGITTITARWYAKSLKGPSAAVTKSPKPQAPAARPAKVATPKPQASTAPNAPAARNGMAAAALGAAGRIVASVKAIAERSFSRARQAKALIPQWQAYVSKQLSLRKAEKKVREELRAITGKAQALERRIKDLTKR